MQFDCIGAAQNSKFRDADFSVAARDRNAGLRICVLLVGTQYSTVRKPRVRWRDEPAR